MERGKTPTFRARTLKRTEAFTLLELIVAILLVSILITFASVNWSGFMRNETETLVDRFSLEVSAIREDAISSYQQRAMQFDLGNNEITVGAFDTARRFDAIRKLDTPDDYVLRDVIVNGWKVSTGKTLMRLYPSGLSDKAIIHLESKSEGFYSIIVQPLTGKVEGTQEYVEEISVREGDNPS